MNENLQHWFNRLKNSYNVFDRIELLKDKNCPSEVVSVMVREDVELDIVRLGILHPNCPEEVITFGKSRLGNPNIKPLLTTTICPVPWNQLEIQQNGDLRICCVAIHEPFGKLKLENNEFANITNVSLEEARNLPLIKELRKSMLNGEKHKMCNQCWEHEELGLSSKRQRMLRLYPEEYKTIDEQGTIDTNRYPLKYMDLRFGNLCNLACRSCGATDSSLWVDDHFELSGGYKGNNVKINWFGNKNYEIKLINNKPEIMSDDFNWYEKDNFWKQFEENAHNIDRLYFTGGEPTINKIHFKVLDFLIANNYSKNIFLEYNSNMVAIPNMLYDKWKQFNKVEIGCSIDGIKEYANYIRPPSQWESLEKNLDHLGFNENQNIVGSIATTISVYNILHFLDLSRWLLSKNYHKIVNIPSFHMLEGPDYLNVQVLPLEVKIKILNEYENFYQEIDKVYNKKISLRIKGKFQGIISHMFSKDRSKSLSKLKIVTERMDKLKNQSLSETIPWLHEILQKY